MSKTKFPLFNNNYLRGHRGGLDTGFPCLNFAINGLPRSECFISISGKRNHGTSTLTDNLTIGLLENNPQVTVLYHHTVDDALSSRIPRLLGARYDVPSDWFKRSGYFLKHPPIKDFEIVFNNAQQWLGNLLHSERLVLYDVAGLPPRLESLEMFVKAIRNKFPKRDLVVMGDNFHLYDLKGFEPGEAKTRAMSMFVKRMANQQHCTILMTAELPEDSSSPGTRPRIARIKGTSGLACDPDANFGVYNDLTDLGDYATLVWHDPRYYDDITGPNGEHTRMDRRLPVVELVIDKTSIFFHLNPISGRITECSEPEQAVYRLNSHE